MTNPNIIGIELLPNQQFIFDVEEPNCKLDETQYCQLVSSGDLINIQEKLIFDPCYDDILCVTELGNDLVTDGDFALGDLSEWTNTGSWQWTSGIACNDGTAGQLSQVLAISNGTPYYVSFTLSNVTTSSVIVALGGTNMSGSPFSVDGTYSAVVIAGAGAGIEFDADTDFDGCIDNISVFEILCWDTTGWSYTPNTSFCNLVSNTTPLQTLANITIACGTGTFELKVTIEGMTDGSITPSIFGNDFPTISTNGTHTVYLNAGGGAPLLITPTTDFNGCITNIELRAMCDYPQLAIFDLDDNLVCYLSGDGGVDTQIDFDRITWSFKLNIMECTIPYGCYKFKISDPCNDCFVSETLVTNGTFDTDLAGWDTTGGTWIWDAGTANLTTIGALIQDFGIDQQVCIRFEVTEYSATGVISNVATLKPNGGGSTNAQVTITGVGVYELFGYGGRIHFSFIVTTIDINLDNIHIIPSDIECGKYCYQVVSNCLNYQLSHDCTKYFTADCEENSLGFVFVNGVSPVFDLRARIRTVTMNPAHPKKRKVELDSSGTKKLVYSESEKSWQLRFDYCDHITHDTISAMVECDNIEINHGLIAGNPTSYNLTKDYVSLQDDYVPEWDSKGQRNLAQSQIEVREVQSTIFNQNLQ